MRKIVSLLMVVSMICTFLPVGARISRAETGSANLFANGGFEQTSTVSGWSGNLAPTGWTRYVFSGTPVFAVDKSVSHSGSQSVRIEASSPSRGTVYQQIGSVTAGRTYKISGWMKTENVSNQALIRYQIGRTSGGNVLINFVTATGTKDWFYFEKTLTMPDNATSPAWLKLEAFLETGTGKVWFDDLAIQEWTGVQGVTLQPPVLSLQKGETASLQPEFLPAEASNRSATWSSSNPETVSVSAYGEVQALADGYSVITVKTEEGGFMDHSVVSVGAPASLSVEPFAGTVEEDGELKGQLKASDSTGAAVTFDKAVDPQNGKLTVFPDGRFLYYPNPDFTGKDEFLFTASTGIGGPKFAEAAVQVTPVNDPPVLDLSWVSTGKNKALTGKLSIATDPEKDSAAWSLVTGPAHGTFELKSDGAYTYTPNGDYTGYDKIRVAAVDGKGGQSEAEFRVYVIPSGEDFIAQFRSRATYGQHPRLLADKPAIESTKRLIGSDPDVTQWFETLKKETEPLLGTAPTPYAPNGANNGAIRDLLIRLGVFYQFSGDSRYAARAIQELEALAAFPDWGARTNNILAMAELSFGVSLAYDLVYEAMTPEQRTLVADAIRVKTLGVALDWYNGVFTHNGEFNNINLVDNGNFGFAAMAIADENPEAEAAAAAVLQGMYKKLQQSLRHYTADGAWPEGPAYWHYGGQYLTYMIAALNNTLGKDYGLSALDGFEESGTFPYHLLGEKGFFDFYDGGISMAQPESMWFADFFQRPEFAWHLGDLSRRKGVYSPLYLMLYKPGMFDTKPVELDKFYSAIESGSMRSAWDDPDALFASMKGLNETLKSHNDLDAGTFVFDALGERWAMDTGNEDYSLPGYWDMKYQRWTLYRKKTEGHNTIVINPVENPVVQQDLSGQALRIREESKPKGAFSILDMTGVYRKDAVQMLRGMKLAEDRSELLIQDEMKLREPSELYWFMHTKAEIEIRENGKAAILRQGDKRVYAQLIGGPADAVFSVMDAVPLPTSPNPDGQTPNRGVRKLTVHLKDVLETSMAVRLVPLYETDPLPETVPALVPLQQWSIPDGTPAPKPVRPLLDSLTVDGQPLKGFTPKGTYYEVAVPFETESIPVVGAGSAHSVTVQQAASIPGSAKITVQDRNDPNNRNSYTVVFKRLPLIGTPEGYTKLKVTGVEASAVPEAVQGNTPEKTIDGDLNTRWSAAGQQWIRYDLGQPQTVSAVAVAIYNGTTRRAYYDIEASLDGLTWTKLESVESSGTTVQPETVLVEPVQARYIRIYGSGNSANNYNSITEVAVYGPPAVSGIRLDKSELLFTQKNETAELKAEVLPEAAVNRSVSWSSADPQVAEVSKQGTVTPKGEGITTVTAVTEEGGFAASAKVTVDWTGPEVSIEVPERMWQTDSVAVRVYAADSVTGVRSLSVTLDGEAKDPSFTISPLDLSAGEHTVKAVAIDGAGHETSKEAVILIDMNAEHLLTVVNMGYDRGWIRNSGIRTSLLSKIDLALKKQGDNRRNDLGALSNEIQAQAGTGMDPQLAKLLREDIAYILESMTP